MFENWLYVWMSNFFYYNTAENVAILSVAPYKKTFSLNSKFKVPTSESKLLF